MFLCISKGTSGPRPQTRCPLGLQCDRRIESPEYGWIWRDRMHTLSVVTNAVDYFQIGSPSLKWYFPERTVLLLSASPEPLGGANLEQLVLRESVGPF